MARWLSVPLEWLWRLTGTVRDRAIRRLDERLDLALTAHAGRLSQQIADAAGAQQEGLRTVEICLESALRELTRLQGLVDELSTLGPLGRPAEPADEAALLPFQHREAA